MKPVSKRMMMAILLATITMSRLLVQVVNDAGTCQRKGSKQLIGFLQGDNQSGDAEVDKFYAMLCMVCIKISHASNCHSEHKVWLKSHPNFCIMNKNCWIIHGG